MTQEYRQHRFTLPEGATDLILIRHGETEAARPGVSFAMKDGHGDPALRPEGEAQAQAVAERLRTEALAAIYVTKLRRTHQTAAPLAEALGLTPLEDPDLHEVHLGDWDGGLYRIKAAENDPAFQRAFERQEWGEIPGAETTASVQTRVRRGLLRIGQAHPNDTVAVIVHGGVIAAAMAVASGSEPFAFRGAENGSISRLVVQGDRFTVRGFNECTHLF